MSRILIWSPNYAPERTGIAALVTDTADWLAERGHELQVIAPVPNYPERRIDPDYSGAVWRMERRGRVDLARSWLRVRPGEGFLDKVLYEATYASVSLPLFLRRLGRADAVVCVVPSLLAGAYASAAVRALGPARPRFVLWLQDLVLSAASTVRGVGPNARRALRVGHALEWLAATGADCVAACSPGFRRHLAGLGVDVRHVVTIYNGVDTEEIRALPPSSQAPLRFLYIGNLGYTQDFESLIDAAGALGGDAELLINGEGNASQEVRRLAASSSNVAVQRPVPRADLPGLLASAHVHVLVQRKGIAEANLPSKLGPYLASGRPVLAAVDEGSPAADLLRASGGALVVPPEAPDELRNAMRRLMGDAAMRERLGRNARDFAERRLSRGATLGRLEQAILG